MNFEEETKHEIKELSKKLDTVLNYLHNNDGTGELGLVAAFKEHEKKMNSFIGEYNTKEAVKKDRIRLAAFLFGGIGTFFTLLINAIIEAYKSK